MNILFENIGSLVSLQPLAKARRAHSVKDSDLGVMHNAWIFCEAGKVSALGTSPIPDSIKKQAAKRIDLEGAYVMPGLVDSHTHAIFGGTRSTEFVQRLNGASYQDIAASGGGIRSTMNATRIASDDELLQSTLRHIDSFQKMGVTTVEIKTGYGLSIEQELRLARILKRLGAKTRSHIVRTCLALHDFSPEFSRSEDYIEALIQELLPILVKEQLVSFVDAFIEKGYYAPHQVENFMLAAKKAGLGIRIHADEFSNAQGAHYAARWGAASADHLQCASEEDAKALARSHTVATLLPGTSLYTGIPFTDARSFLKEGCALAIASDFNPGSSYVKNLAQLATIGAIHCHLKSWEALAAVTYAPAHSLSLGDSKGALSPNFDADFLVYKMNGVEDWLADMGQTAPKEVWIRGKKVC